MLKQMMMMMMINKMINFKIQNKELILLKTILTQNFKRLIRISKTKI